MHTARFLYDIYEEKYAINPYYSWGHDRDGNWHLGDEYTGISFPVGYKTRKVMRYIKIKEKDVVLHTEEISIEFEVGNRVRCGKEVVTITSLVKNLDGSIDYYTDKRVYVPINTRDTYFDERPVDLHKVIEEPINIENNLKHKDNMDRGLIKLVKKFKEMINN